jgi:cell division protein ZapE
MTPIDFYHNQCHQGLINADHEQLVVLALLQVVYEGLLSEHKQRSRVYSFLRKPKQVKGAYIWGGVGIGKTFIMDCFYESIPFKEKLRIHFHQFMKLIHLRLKECQGEKNPLELIAKELAQKTIVLCFDELFVSDIVDAMILARLFKALVSYGVCLVATSNMMPDDLYKRGLQRELFLPAIDLLKQITNVVNVTTSIDYRLRHSNDNEIAEAHMEQCFSMLTNNADYQTGTIQICDRPILIKKYASDVLWFDFDAICTVPRSQHDYLTIAEKYKTVMISNIPYISPEEKNTINLFVKMVDVFYDARVRLIYSSGRAVEEIYTAGHMMFEFARTRSRLVEMQSRFKV